ncbi:type II toxin-antitoxin system prevent-host-death family antitoxin [Bosea sp. 124]|uniref:type II toxin-antitoxin system Phd/YefM family antitoxin n=1 Tax=Bosea sp. 124 TaxID=2135642 RepID=UPI000D39C878|nr:type II toxin-antitoxin system prevent-host-death family antitoxin [Bosea sp. 124]PTM39220.1 prevent-host-death family protein [Bosea sp. 124]
MTRVTIHEAKTHLSRLLEEVEKGGEVVISRRDKPIARLVPIEQKQPERKPGRMKGLIDIGPEFFEPLPEEELRLCEGRDD